jgi:ligand-binding sensor domain-containing protein
MNNLYKKLSIIFLFESFFVYGQHTIQNFNSENSLLPFNTIRCITIQNEIKWFGTDAGLASFDGLNWQVFSSNNSPLTDNDIRALKVQNDSTLWIGTMQGGLFKKTNDVWINFNAFNSGLHDNLVRGIEIDSLGHIWLATSEGVTRFDGENWLLWNITNNGLLTNNITAIRAGFLNEKYIGTINGGLLYFDPQDNLTIHSIVDSGLPDNSSLDIDIDSTGQPWYATPAAGLVTDWGNGGPWQRWNMSNSPIPTNGLTCIAINPDDQRIFMGTELFGIMIKKGDVWINYNQTNIGLPENHITAIAHESPTVKWIGTFNHGVIRLEENIALSENYILEKTRIFPSQIQAGEWINIFPNPAIKFVQLIDQLGHEQPLENINGQVLIPSTLASGIYYLRITDSSIINNFKILIY